MPETATHVLFAGVAQGERERIVQWRVEQLIAAEFDPAAARRIAERGDVDLHEATDMRKAGCTGELVERILL